MITWMVILSFLLLAMIVWAGFATIGMLKGLKKVEYYESTLGNIRQRILDTYKQMREIDTLGAFKSDDDVGVIFTELKTLVDELQNYTNEETNLENINGQKKNNNIE